MTDDHAEDGADKIEITADQTAATAVLWEQSKAAIDRQNSDFDLLRTRAVALLSVGTLVGGLFGSRLPHGHLSGLAVVSLVIALALFALSVCVAIFIAWPRKWNSGEDRMALVEGVADGTKTLAEVNLSLAVSADENWEVNDATTQSLAGLFALLCAVTGLEVVAWALAVI
jgi:hypothetical protein